MSRADALNRTKLPLTFHREVVRRIMKLDVDNSKCTDQIRFMESSKDGSTQKNSLVPFPKKEARTISDEGERNFYS